MRFDDTLDTVLAADLSTPFGMASAWRQLVDLIGRRRVPADIRALDTLRRIRGQVPPPVRAASARGLEAADPPLALVKLFALDEIAIAAPVLRSARIASSDWVAMLPELSPSARAVLRHRRDLSPVVRRALESFGPIDFVLPDHTPRIVAAPVTVPEPEPEPITVVEILLDWTEVVAARPPAPVTRPVAAKPAEQLLDWTEVVAARPAEVVARPVAPSVHELVDRLKQRERAPDAVPEVVSETAEPEIDLSFVALAGGVAAVAELSTAISPAPVQSGTFGGESGIAAVESADAPAHGPDMKDDAFLVAEPPAAAPEAGGQATEIAPQSFVPQGQPPADGPFEIADVVARIDAFWRRHPEAEEQRVVALRPLEPASDFRFETDAKGVIRWVDGVSRAPIIGLSLDLQGLPGGSRVDGVAAGAFRRRAGFSNARLQIEGESDASGAWLISAIPVFDPANGRFTGYRGTARRPRVDERAEPAHPAPRAAADSLRQLVHELRTPTNAIAGFAEMIETQMLGPVSDPYRARAGVIREQARDLLGAIDDLDLAARIESDALSLIPGRVVLRQLLTGIADDLAQLAQLRGSWIALPVDDLAVSGDRRAVERLLARLMATLVSASGPGERIGVRTALDGDDVVVIAIDRPRALADFEGDAMLGIDDETGDASLLGTGFALRLARNLARELGGSLIIEADSLTLRLPAAEVRSVEQAHLN